MILVTLGTQDKSFSRLLDMIEECIKEKIIKEEIIVQAGFTKYESDNMKIFDYIDMKEFDKLLTECDVLITHGGVGTIVSAVKQGKKVIASPRLSKYNEHHNDHQCQIIESFKEEGYILSCTNLEELKIALKQSDTFVPREFKSNKKKFLKLIRGEIGI